MCNKLFKKYGDDYGKVDVYEYNWMLFKLSKKYDSDLLKEFVERASDCEKNGILKNFTFPGNLLGIIHSNNYH